MPSVKGTLLNDLGEYVAGRQGPEAWRALVDALPESDRAVLDGLLLVGGWYPVGVWNRCIASYITQHAHDADAEMTAVAHHIADRDLNTVFKVLLNMGSAEFVLERSDSLWSRYFDVGKVEQREIETNQWAIKLTAPVGENDA